MSVTATNIRRIIKIGERSIGITIPKEWLNILGVDVGSSVEVSLAPGYIIVKPIGAVSQKLIRSVKISHDDPAILSRLIIASYIEGYDVILVDSARDVARKSFYSIAMRLPGAIAMEGTEFKIKVSVDELNTDLNEVVSSMRITLNMMFELLIDYFNTGDKRKLEEALKLDDDLDRLHFLAMRAIKRTAYREPIDSPDYAIVIKSLEHVGDALDRAANTLLKMSLNGLQTNSECRALFRDMYMKVLSYVSKAVNSLTTNNIVLAMKVLLSREDLAKDFMDSVKKCIELPGALALTHEAIVALYEAAEISEVAVLRILKSLEEKHKVVSKEVVSQQSSE